MHCGLQEADTDCTWVYSTDTGHKPSNLQNTNERWEEETLPTKGKLKMASLVIIEKRDFRRAGRQQISLMVQRRQKNQLRQNNTTDQEA